jgi:hypothetical protein
MKHMGSLLLILLFPLTTPAQAINGKAFPEETTKRLTAEIEKQLRGLNLPGVLVAVTVPGEGKIEATLHLTRPTSAIPRPPTQRAGRVATSHNWTDRAPHGPPASLG